MLGVLAGSFALVTAWEGGWQSEAGGAVALLLLAGGEASSLISGRESRSQRSASLGPGDSQSGPAVGAVGAVCAVCSVCWDGPPFRSRRRQKGSCQAAIFTTGDDATVRLSLQVATLQPADQSPIF